MTPIVFSVEIQVGTIVCVKQNVRMIILRLDTHFFHSREKKFRQQNFRAQRAIQRNPDCKNYLLKDKCLVYDYKNPSHNPCTVESGDKSGRAKKRIDKIGRAHV